MNKTIALSETIPLEHCALKFALQWHKAERDLRTHIQEGKSIEKLRLALRHFQVARNFADLANDEVAQGVLTDTRETIKAGRTGVELVKELSDKFKRRVGKTNVSAASKLLWLSGSEVVIYDSRALNALNDMGCVLRAREYGAYCEAWREIYASLRPKIAKATTRLQEIRGFLPPDLTAAAPRLFENEEWFLERVFDIYLWEAGGEG